MGKVWVLRFMGNTRHDVGILTIERNSNCAVKGGEKEKFENGDRGRGRGPGLGGQSKRHKWNSPNEAHGQGEQYQPGKKKRKNRKGGGWDFSVGASINH